MLGKKCTNSDTLNATLEGGASTEGLDGAQNMVRAHALARTLAAATSTDGTALDAAEVHEVACAIAELLAEAIDSNA